MARITISDVLPQVNNKYELGMLAGQRVRDLNGGETPTIPVHPKDKTTVTALREIAKGTLDIDGLRAEFIQSYKKVPVADDDAKTLESNAETPELKELDEELSGVAAMKEEIAQDIADEAEAADADSESAAAGADAPGTVDAVAESPAEE